mgnify:CR=1 FL=1
MLLCGLLVGCFLWLGTLRFNRLLYSRLCLVAPLLIVLSRTWRFLQQGRLDPPLSLTSRRNTAPVSVTIINRNFLIHAKNRCDTIRGPGT